MRKVLVVDDTKNIRVLLTTCLELRDYEVITADNGKAALETVKNHKKDMDLIFLDIRMPEMNGTEVLKAIRDLGISCPVIIMTAYATVKNAIDCTRLGAVAYLQKPFSIDRVNSVLDEIFSLEPAKAPKKESKNDAYYVEKAKNFMRDGKFSEAYGSLKLALGKNPYNKEIYLLIAQVNENANNIKEAKRFSAIAKLFEE